MRERIVYKIEKSPLYRLRNKRKLAELLGEPLQDLLKLTDDDQYRVFCSKSRGKKREIQEPKKQLKRVQRVLKKYISRIETPSWVMSGKKGVSYITNAKAHLGARFLVNVDIQSFYTNSSKTHVYDFFRVRLKMDSDLAWLLTDLVTYNDFIPTGSPTSQLIAYWAYESTFLRIKSLTQRHSPGCIFTVYVDDLSISCDSLISSKIPFLINLELKRIGHSLKQKKTKFYYPKDHKQVTGCAQSPNGKLEVLNKARQKITNLIEGKKIESLEIKKQKSLFGMIQTARQIDDEFMKPTYMKLKGLVY